MKINKLLSTCLRIFFVGVFILSLGTPNSARAAGGADLHVDKTLNGGNFTQGEQGRTYTIVVSNEGDDPTDGTLVTVTDTLPTGLTATAISGTGWSCTLGTLTCTRSDVLPGEGGTYPPITLTVNVGNPTSPAINDVTVSGGGDNDEEGNHDTVTTTVNMKPDLIITGYEFRNAANNAVITTVSANEAFYIRMTVKNQGGADTGLFYPGVFLDGKPNYGIDHDEPPTLVLGQVTNFSGYKIAPEGSNGYPQGGCLYYDPAGTINPIATQVITERGNYTRSQYNDSLPAGASTTVDVYIGYPEGEFPSSIYNSIRTGLAAGNYNIYLYVDPNCSGGDRESFEDNNSWGPIPLTVTGSSACTIPTGNPPVFADVPASHWAVDYIEAMYYCGYTAGCSTSGTLNYCPQTVMSRAESSVFILRGNFGTTYTPPSAPWNTFSDDFSSGPWAQKWVQGLFNAGLTAGCNSAPLLFCPWDQTPRVQLAVFGVRLKYGSSFVPPPATGTVFADLTDPNYFGTKWAEQAYADGLIPSCGTSGGKPLFCPNSLVDRALAAYTVVKAKNLLP